MSNQILNMARTFLLHFLLAFIATESLTMPSNIIVTVNICSTTALSSNGNKCYPCNAGYHKTGDCVKDKEQARCTPCSPGTFQPNCSMATSCAPCSPYCMDRRLIKSRGCTPFADIECTCKAGYFWEAESANKLEGVCNAHSPCISGFGLKEKGDAYKDTVCEPCRPGAAFSNSSSFEPCRLCTVCKHYNTSCTSGSDATCSNRAPERSGLPPVAIALIAIGSFVAICFGISTTIGYFRRRMGCQKRGNQGTSDVESQTGTQLDNVIERTPLIPTGDRDQYEDTIQSSDCHANVDANTDANDDSIADACGNGADMVATRDGTTCTMRLSDNQTDSQLRTEIHLGTCPIGEDDKRLHSNTVIEAVNRLQLPNPDETEENSLRGTSPISSEDKRLHSVQMINGFNNLQIFQQPGNYASARVPQDQNAPESTGQRDTRGDDALVPEHQNADLRNPDDKNATKYAEKHDTAADALRTSESKNSLASDRSGSDIHDASQINRPRKPNVVSSSDRNVWGKPFRFLANISPNDFNQFFRSLADYRNVDSWIDVAKQENHAIDERQYQLMRRVHKRQPSLSHDDISRALRDVDLNRIAEDYEKLFLETNC